MATPRNDHCFSQPHWLVIARGFKTETWFNDGQAVGTGGIASPQAVPLRQGNRYYRFASSVTPLPNQVGGGWWIEFESFNTIQRFAREHGYSLSDAARLFLALPYDWTRVDRLVSAILEVPLKAYAGLGKPAQGGSAATRDAGTAWIPLQHRRVVQLYIPGLYVPEAPMPGKPYEKAFPAAPRRQLYEEAFPQPDFEYVMGNRRRV